MLPAGVQAQLLFAAGDHDLDPVVHGRAYMLPLDDQDLQAFVDERRQLADGQDFRFLHDRFKQIAS